MIDITKELYKDGKRSLESLLRERAYTEVESHLRENGIDIKEVADEDIETLVAAKVQDNMSMLKGAAIATAFSLAFSLLTGGL